MGKQLLINYFNGLLKNVDQQMKKIMNDIPTRFFLTDFLSKSEQEIKGLFELYGIQSSENISKEFALYKMFSDNTSLQSSFGNNYNILLGRIKEYLKELNAILDDKIKDMKKKIELFEIEKIELEKVIKIIFDKEELEYADYDIIYTFVKGLNISDNEKLELSQQITIYLNNRIIELINFNNEKHINEKAEIIEYANGVYKSFFTNNEKLGEYVKVKDLETLFDENEISELSNNGYSLEMFAHALLIQIRAIQNENISLEELKTHKNKIEELLDMYSCYVKVNDYYNRMINSLSSDNMLSLTSSMVEKVNEISNYIYSINDEIKLIKQDINLLRKLEELSSELGRILENKSIDQRMIKEFIIFPYDENQIPFIISDLIDGKMIDNSTEEYHNHTYAHVVSDLFYDIITIGQPRYLNSIDTSVQNVGEKIISPVCFKSKKGNVDWGNKTDMWRIRPSRNSSIRYVERQVILNAGTKIYEQVINIISSYMKNVVIDQNKDFILSINFCTGVKKADVGLYEAAIKRRYSANEVGNYIINMLSSDKKELTDDELAFLDNAIQISLKAYDDIRERDNSYNFNYIDEMVGGGLKHGK